MSLISRLTDRAGASRASQTRTGILSSANGLLLPLGLASDPTSVRGYPIDFRVKAESPKWTPPDGTPPGNEFVYVAQFGLGAYERWVMGEGEQWLQTAIEIA